MVDFNHYLEAINDSRFAAVKKGFATVSTTPTMADIEQGYTVFARGDSKKAGVTDETFGASNDAFVGMHMQICENCSPIREFLETWISGVRDPRSGL